MNCCIKYPCPLQRISWTMMFSYMIILYIISIIILVWIIFNVFLIGNLIVKRWLFVEQLLSILSLFILFLVHIFIHIMNIKLMDHLFLIFIFLGINYPLWILQIALLFLYILSERLINNDCLILPLFDDALKCNYMVTKFI